MRSKLRRRAQRLRQFWRFSASLGVYWISTFFGGRLRVRWLSWAYALDDRNKLALHDLVDRCPAALGADAQTTLQQWAYSIVQGDPLTFAKVVETNATTESERGKASLIDWAYRCPADDAVALFNLAQRAAEDNFENLTARHYPWAYLAQQHGVPFVLDVVERFAPTGADKMLAWLARWTRSLEWGDFSAIVAAIASAQGEDPRVDAFYALVAAKTEASRHPQAHLAQRLAIHLSSQTYEQSVSQNFQDRFVLFALGERRGQGYFVEFGVDDGLELSNTYLLERDLGWSGIVAEPNPARQTAVRRYRHCHISDHCVWSRSGEKVRFQVVDLYPALSTIAEYQDVDYKDRSRATTIEVPTITLNDLLKQHNAPRRIDYISIDTEGSELAILEAFDFTAYDVSVFTIEHNFTPARAKLHRLMQQQGYTRVLEAFSRWDDWYVRADLAAQLGIPASSERPLKIAG